MVSNTWIAGGLSATKSDPISLLGVEAPEQEDEDGLASDLHPEAHRQRPADHSPLPAAASSTRGPSPGPARAG
jgi:hypothetical protein